MASDKPECKIAPSMLSSDFAFLGSEAQKMLSMGADWLHMDVMDGHFVPNLTIGAPIIKSLRKHTDGFLDCHLMVTHPRQWIPDFIKAGASQITFHYEAVEDREELIQEIKKYGVKAGIAVSPKTEIGDDVLKIAGQVDLFLVMTVEPGFGGQSFMGNMVNKIEKLRKAYPQLNIGVDGGIGLENIEIVSKAGANVIVAGTSIFGSKDPQDTISKLRDVVLKNL